MGFGEALGSFRVIAHMEQGAQRGSWASSTFTSRRRGCGSAISVDLRFWLGSLTMTAGVEKKPAVHKMEAPSNTLNTVSLTHSTGALKHGRLSLEPHPIQQVCGGSA